MKQYRFWAFFVAFFLALFIWGATGLWFSHAWGAEMIQYARGSMAGQPDTLCYLPHVVIWFLFAWCGGIVWVASFHLLLVAVPVYTFLIGWLIILITRLLTNVVAIRVYG